MANVGMEGANVSKRARHAIFGHYRNGNWVRFQCDPHDDLSLNGLLTDCQKRLLRMENGVGSKIAADIYE